MEPVGNQNFWQPEDGDEAVSQYAGYDVDETPDVDSPIPTLSWQASEYIHHEKNTMWFVSLIGGSLVLSALALFLIRSWTFTLLVLVMAVAVIVYARRPPKIINYTLNDHGLQMNEQSYSYHDFRAFGIVQDGPFYSVILLPVKRFKPSVTVYFPAENGEQIVDAFGSTLPMERVELDLVEKLVRKIRF